MNDNLATPTTSRASTAIWQFCGSSFSNLLLIAQGLIFVPLYIDILGNRLFGFWLASGGILAWLAMVDVGGSAMTTQRCAAAFAQHKWSTVVSYFWHGAAIMAGVATLFAVLLLPAGFIVSGFIGVDANQQDLIQNCFWVAGVGLMFGFPNQFLYGFASAIQNNRLSVAGMVIGDLGSITAIGFGLAFDYGLWALAFAALVRGVVPFFVNIVHVAMVFRGRSAKFQWSPNVFRDYVTTIPSILGAKASGQFVMQIPVVILTRTFGPEATVIYAVSIRGAQVVEQVVGQAINALTGPASHLLHDAKVKTKQLRHAVGAATHLFVVSTAVALFGVVAANRGFVSLWTSESQFGGQIFSFFAGCAWLLLLWTRFAEALLGSTGAMKKSASIVTVERISRSVVLIMFTCWFGFLGAPVAMCTTLLVSLPVLLRALEKTRPEFLGLYRTILPKLAAAIVGLAMANLFATWISKDSWLNWLISSIVVTALAGLIAVSLTPRATTTSVAAVANLFRKMNVSKSNGTI